MSAIQLKVLLNAAYQVIDNARIFLLDDRLNILSDGCFQCSNAARFVLEKVVLEEPPEEGIWVVQVKRVRYPFHLYFTADETLLNFLQSHVVIT